MLININIKLIFSVRDSNETFSIDSLDARKANSIVPYIAIAARSEAGVTPIINISISNLTPEFLAKFSLIDSKTNVQIFAGYNDNYVSIAEGIIVSFPEFQPTDTEWLWTADITPLNPDLDKIDYTENFSKGDTWGNVIEQFFGKSKIPYVIPDKLESTSIDSDISFNINTFVGLQDFFKARGFELSYKDRIIIFTDGKSNAIASTEITSQQVKPNQYLDFRPGRPVPLNLAGWIPAITSGIYVNLKDPEAVTTLIETTKGFTGTMYVLKSMLYLSTTEQPRHTIHLTPLTKK